MTKTVDAGRVIGIIKDNKDLLNKLNLKQGRSFDIDRRHHVLAKLNSSKLEKSAFLAKQSVNLDQSSTED